MTLQRQKQKGAVMIEAAYFLPLLIGVVLFIIEAVGYGLNSFVVNDTITDIHSTITNEIQEVAALEAGQTANTLYVSCNSGRVGLKADIESAINTKILADLSLIPVELTEDNPGRTTVTQTSDSGFDIYRINFKGEAVPIVLPNFLSGLLVINVDTLISIKDSCVSS
ncbi:MULTISPECIES: TadE/TadG family type IV pilus assembly protein [Thiomicrorhabdus]|uniref:Pilus assembly protein n=1 Tax=Thiomicrorhabdus heinhorstiae TaxID=2748010 RepID=A0ABS0BY04_9GAMM|nr:MULTISPECIES: hypothetical protein [Thiomicrorhabdus]MBF6058660.1 hypothetical protein [Thiomicrorhabdus heinhorstiae]